MPDAPTIIRWDHDMYGVRDVADMLGVTTHAVRRWIRRGSNNVPPPIEFEGTTCKSRNARWDKLAFEKWRAAKEQA